LASEGLADNTVILFTSDNGYNAGSHGFGDKVIPYEEGSKSPLIIYDPRLPKQQSGKVSEALTANIDMPATILAISDVPTPAEIDGKNLLPLLADPRGQVRDFLPLFNFWGAPSAQSMAVVTPEWKYIYWYYCAGGMRPTEELFHLGQDRFETVTLTGEPRYANDLAKMRQRYDTELAAIKAKVVKGHGYEPYPTLFSRAIAWDEKVPLLSTLADNESSEGQDASKSKVKNLQGKGKPKRKTP